MRVAPPVILSPEERMRLHRWKAGSGPRRWRAAIVLLAAEGRQNREIARLVKVDRLTVGRWRHRFLAERLAGLEAGRGATRPGRIAVERLRALLRASEEVPPAGRGRWSSRTLARRFGVSHMTVRRLLSAHGISSATRHAVAGRADPTNPLRPSDLVGVHLRGRTVAVAMTLSRGRASLSLGRAPVALPPEIPAAGTPDLLGSIAGPGPLARRVDRSAGLRRFISALPPIVWADDRVLLIVSGISAEELRWFDRWRVRHPRFEVRSQPNLERWRSDTLHALEDVALGPRPRGEYRGRAELAQALRRFLMQLDGAAAPFTWVAPRTSARDSKAAYRLRYDLAVTGRKELKSHLPDAPPVTAPADLPDSHRKSARAVLGGNLRVRRGERITIEAWSSTLDYANAFVLEALRLGARPLLLYQDEPTYWAATTEVPARALASLGEHRRAALSRTETLISFFGPSDRERFHALPSAILFRLGEYQDSLYAAAARGGARAIQMAVGRVSAPSARLYGVDEERWHSELVGGTLVGPASLSRRGIRIARRLRLGKLLRIVHPDGTDLHLRLRGLPPHLADGRVPRRRARQPWSLVTLPAGVVSVAVDEGFAEGQFVSNVRCATGLSDSVGDFDGGRWTFRRGRLERFRYDTGQAVFEQSYSRAGPGRDRPGALSIGLNERIVSAPLLEDQSLGTVTLQLGRNASLGGRNRGNWWAWSFLRGGSVEVDGRPLVTDGSLEE